MAVVFDVGSGQGEDMAYECLQPGAAALTKVKRLERSAP